MAQTQTQIATNAITAVTSSTNVVSNFNPGSGIRTVIDMASSEGALIEQQIEDQVATGVLNALYQLLGVSPTGAVGSTYLQSFTLASSSTSSYTLVAGSLVQVPSSNLQWETGQSITIAPGTTVQTTVTCTSTGIITNVPANTITQLVVPATGLTTTNASAQPIVQGRDAQTQIELQAQLSNLINELHKGDQSACEVAALAAQVLDASGNPTEEVVKAFEMDVVASTAYPINAVMFVNNGAGTASSALLAQVTNNLTGYTDTNGNKVVGAKAAGIIYQVIDAPQTPVPVSVAVLPANGYTLAMISTGVLLAIQDYFDGLDLASSFSVTPFAYAILAVQGVADVQVLSPSANLPAVPAIGAPTMAPILTAVSGSTTLLAGTYEVGYTYTNPWGETTLSPTASVTITAGESISVDAITLPTGVMGVNYYMTQVGGSTPYYLKYGTGAVYLIANAPTSSTTAPSASTAYIQGNAYVLSGTPTITQATT